MSGCDLDVPEVHASVEHGGHEGVAEHVGMHPGGRDPGDLGQGAEPASGTVAIHPVSGSTAQDGSAGAAVGGAVDGPSHCRWQGYQGDLVALVVDS
jgi:hypothetical protein